MTGMERLQFMVGDWDIQAWTPDGEGGWVDSPLPKSTRIDPLFNGAFLREEEVAMQAGGKVIRFFIMWSYDQYRGCYRMLACDDSDGLMDILEGNFNTGTDTIMVSNLGTGTRMLDEDGNPVSLRLVSTRTGADSFLDEMFESADDGGSWHPVYRALHNRTA